jgi:hypothetical protein
MVVHRSRGLRIRRPGLPRCTLRRPTAEHPNPGFRYRLSRLARRSPQTRHQAQPGPGPEPFRENPWILYWFISIKAPMLLDVIDAHITRRLDALLQESRSVR